MEPNPFGNIVADKMVRPMMPFGPLTQGQQTLYDLAKTLNFNAGYSSPNFQMGFGGMPFGPQMSMAGPGMAAYGGMPPHLLAQILRRNQQPRMPYVAGGAGMGMM